MDAPERRGCEVVVWVLVVCVGGGGGHLDMATNGVAVGVGGLRRPGGG